MQVKDFTDIRFDFRMRIVSRWLIMNPVTARSKMVAVIRKKDHKLFLKSIYFFDSSGDFAEGYPKGLDLTWLHCKIN